MSFIITLVAAVFVFGLVIAIHEFGHFALAKLSGIQVNEFSIGMGPALLKKIWHGTQYSLRLLPIGGYVAMEGEDSPESQPAGGESKDNGENGGSGEEAPLIPPELRTGKPFNEVAVWKRFLTVAAGAVMNFVLGFVVLLLVVATQQDVITSKTVYSIEEGALCGQTGLQPGDTILAVNGRRCFIANDIIYELVRTEAYQADFTVERGGQRLELPAVQFDTWQDEDGQTHMTMGFVVYGVKKTVKSVVQEAFNSELYYGRIIFTSLADLIRGRESINDLSGPVGIVSAIGTAAGYGLGDLLELLALITVNLGIFNLLPFPALDGGKLVFLLIEGVSGHAVPDKVQGAFNLVGLALLFALMLFATYNDVVRLITGAL